MASESKLATGFPAAAFRDNIRETMLMGMPENVADRLTFHWDVAATYVTTNEDLAGEPLDWDAVPATETEHESTAGVTQTSLSLPYALEFSSRPAGSTQNAVGEVDAARATVTMLDVDYVQVADADYATVGPIRFRIQFVAPEVAMFPVGVHVFYLEAEDEA